MKIRELKTNDMFKISRILKKMKLKFDTTGKTQEQVGVEMITVILENLYLAEEETNAFLGSLVNLSSKEFGELPFSETVKIIQQIKDTPGIASFFKSASQ